MPDALFVSFERRLLERGVAARHAERLTQELHDHYHDLREEYAAQGMGAEPAGEAALRQLGALDELIACVARRRELRAWCYRYPQLGRVALPVACLLSLPAVPLMAGVGYAPTIARWSAIMSLSALVTAAIFFAMQVSITLG